MVEHFKTGEVTVTEENRKLIYLLGNFIVAWSIFDQVIDVSIYKHLGVTPRQAAIMLAGIGFEKKVKILRSLINESETPNKEAIAAIREIMGLARRNVLLHASIWNGKNTMEFYRMDTDQRLEVKHAIHDFNSFQNSLLKISANISKLQTLLDVPDAELDTLAKIGKSLSVKTSTSPSPPSSKKAAFSPRQRK